MGIRKDIRQVLCPKVHSQSHQPLISPPQSFLARPSEQVAPELIGCLLVEPLPANLHVCVCVCHTLSSRIFEAVNFRIYNWLAAAN